MQKTNHYILLTNISIKRCIKTSFETDLLGGGKSSNQTSTLQTELAIITLKLLIRRQDNDEFNVTLAKNEDLFRYLAKL